MQDLETLLFKSNLGKLQTEGRFFKSQIDGRTVFLRGVNLSGSTKQPFTPYLPSHEPKDFFDGENVSFVGRPFPLAEADEHFARLKSWGFNFLRFNVTWEAIEHSGPGIYDKEYIDYVIAILLKAQQYGFRVFIDPHQDVWSRFTGGSGAPLWTLKVAGFDPANFNKTFSAIVQNTFSDPSKFPKMIWPTNYWKLAASTMFTLFFGGKVFAPNCMVDGVNIQDYLQNHYFNAICHLAKAVQATPGLGDHVVMGYDTLNEPSMGLLGVEDISKIAKEQELRKGLTPTPFQGMLLGMGLACEGVEEWDMTAVGPQKIADRTLDPKGVKAWSPNQSCIWASEGVWDISTRQVLKPNYFSIHPESGQHVDPLRQFWKPFVNDFSRAIRNVHPRSIIFVEPPVNALPPVWEDGDVEGPIVFAPHWYDGLTLINKHFNTWFNVDYIGFLRGKYSSIAFALKFGEAAIKKGFQSQLRTLREEGEEAIGLYPTLFGEIGIPYDLDGKAAYLTGDYSSQLLAMDANMTALERDLLSFTLWNYTSDNCHQWGDQWNGEDLSLWSKPIPPSNPSPDSKTTSPPIDLNAGARALEAFVRPFPLCVPGTPKLISFDMKEQTFIFTFTHSVREDGKWDAYGSCRLGQTHTELYLPLVHFPNRDCIDVWVSSGTVSILIEKQRVLWKCGCELHASSSSPVHDDDEVSSGGVSRTSGDPLTAKQDSKVGDYVIAHKIVIRRKTKENPLEEGGLQQIVEYVEAQEHDSMCPSYCSIM